jgi:hypothetical protein
VEVYPHCSTGLRLYDDVLSKRTVKVKFALEQNRRPRGGVEV